MLLEVRPCPGASVPTSRASEELRRGVLDFLLGDPVSDPAGFVRGAKLAINQAHRICEDTIAPAEIWPPLCRQRNCVPTFELSARDAGPSHHHIAIESVGMMQAKFADSHSCEFEVTEKALDAARRLPPRCWIDLADGRRCRVQISRFDRESSDVLARVLMRPDCFDCWSVGGEEFRGGLSDEGKLAFSSAMRIREFTFHLLLCKLYE